MRRSYMARSVSSSTGGDAAEAEPGGQGGAGLVGEAVGREVVGVEFEEAVEVAVEHGQGLAGDGRR